jgi:hypothetical protein
MSDIFKGPAGAAYLYSIMETADFDEEIQPGTGRGGHPEFAVRAKE